MQCSQRHLEKSGKQKYTGCVGSSLEMRDWYMLRLSGGVLWYFDTHPPPPKKKRKSEKKSFVLLAGIHWYLAADIL